MPLNYKSIQKSSTAAQGLEVYECTVTSALVKSMSIYNGSGGSADVIAKIQKSGQSQKVLYQNKSIVADSTIQLLNEVVILENGDKIYIEFSAGGIDSTTMLVESTAVLNATSVKELSDWSTTAPNDGQVPTWNSATGQYEPEDSSATISGLDDINDVSASSPTNGDVIVYNGAINTWVTSQSLANLVDTVKDPTPDTTVIEKDASNKITIDSTTGSEKISATVDGTKALELTDTEARVLSVVVQDQNEVQFKQLASNGSNYVSLKAPAQLASNVDFVLPNADGASGTFLKTNGSGALSFASITEATGSELENVVEDTTPQLGGDLDVNGNKIVSASNGDIVLEPDGTGNVGIGTTTPNYLLDVESDGAGARIYNTAGSSQLHLQAYTNYNSVVNFGDVLDPDVGAILYRHASDSLAFNVNAAERIRIDSSGNVGIGTTSPGQALHVVGNTFSSGSIGNKGINIGQQLELGTSAVATLRFDADAWRLYSGGAGSSGEVFRVTETGNVGIGTTTPTAKLEVASNKIKIGDSVGQTISIEGTSTTNIIRFRNAGGSWLGTQSNGINIGDFTSNVTTSYGDVRVGNYDFEVIDNSDNRLLFINNSSGNVGIGTASPSAKLDVVGLANINDGSSNVMISSGNTTLTGTSNTAVGYLAGASNTSGSLNSFFGVGAGHDNTSGENNSFFGRRAGYSNASGVNNSFFGRDAGYSNTSGGNNSFFGRNAGYYSTGSSNVLLGYGAGFGSATSTFSNTVAVGYQALTALTTGAQNTAVGFSSLRDLTAGANNTAVGYQSMLNSTTGTRNTAVGQESLNDLTTGAENTAVGFRASANLTTSNYNVSVGGFALYTSQTGGANTAIGYGAAYSTTSDSNTAVGYLAGYFGNTNNASLGARALNNTTGSYNVAVGSGAAQGVNGVSTFSNAVAVGYQAGIALTTGGSNVLIGYQAGSTLTTESNKLYIENSNSSTPLIYGEFDNDLVRVNGDFEATGGYGFNGESATAVQTGYTPTNVTTTRSFDADSVTLDSLADVVGTLIEDLKTKGLISA